MYQNFILILFLNNMSSFTIYILHVEWTTTKRNFFGFGFGFCKEKIFSKILNYARNVYVYCDILVRYWNTVKYYFVRWNSLKSVVGTLHQYLFERYTFYHAYSMFCTWSPVAYNLQLIVILNLNRKTLTAEDWFWKRKKNHQTEAKNSYMYQLCKKRICTATYVLKHI